MSIVIISGSNGLIGSEAVRFFADQGFIVIGIDNDMRRVFFGEGASTHWQKQQLINQYKNHYIHYDTDIRDYDGMKKIFAKYAKNINLIIHAAAQPSHDWASKEPLTDFSINANGTLNLLEATRNYNNEAVFIYTSTNKVYGDTPNQLPLIEKETRWEIPSDHTYYNGIREDMTVDQSLHSLFGASKLAADILVQEYGRYFEMYTGCFRGGCLTGPNHSGAELHGFLAYLMKCNVLETPYKIFGYKGKQVRDNIHSLDVIQAFYEFLKSPRIGEVYNIGGGRYSNCSLLEAISVCETITRKPQIYKYSEQNRKGDHIWWITDNSKFQSHYPGWHPKYDVPQILEEIYLKNRVHWIKSCS